MKKNRTKLFSLTKKDFKIEATRGTGNGGQKKNKTSSAIRITHLATGISGYAEDFREQAKNRKLAFQRLTENPEFKAWLNLAIEVAQNNVEMEYLDDSGKPVKRLMTLRDISIKS